MGRNNSAFLGPGLEESTWGAAHWEGARGGLAHSRATGETRSSPLSPHLQWRTSTSPDAGLLLKAQCPTLPPKLLIFFLSFKTEELRQKILKKEKSDGQLGRKSGRNTSLAAY